MDLNSYMEFTRETAKYPKDEVSAVIYTSLGLSGEAGEVCNKVKKIIRDDNNIISDSKREDLMDELGDVIWYFVRLSDELGLDVNDVINRNVEKLTDRLKRNVISGSGDKR